MSYNASFRALLEAIGITNEKLPVEGLTPREVRGFLAYNQPVTVWVAPLVRGRFSLRVMAKCPKCGKTLSASRLPQHMGKGSCVKRAEANAARDAANSRAFRELAEEATAIMRAKRAEVVAAAWPEGTRVTVELDGARYPVIVRQDNGNGMLYVMHASGGHEWVQIRNRYDDGTLIVDSHPRVAGAGYNVPA